MEIKVSMVIAVVLAALVVVANSMGLPSELQDNDIQVGRTAICTRTTYIYSTKFFQQTADVSIECFNSILSKLFVVSLLVNKNIVLYSPNKGVFNNSCHLTISLDMSNPICLGTLMTF